MYIITCIILSIFLLFFQFQFCDFGAPSGIQNIWGCLLNLFHHMLYEIGKTTFQNSDFIQIWKFSQIWISFQYELVRLESDLKNSIMALPYLSIPSSICVEMLKFGTFCHFQKAHRAPDRFLSLNNPLKLKGLGALCKISHSTQD